MATRAPEQTQADERGGGVPDGGVKAAENQGEGGFGGDWAV